MGPARAVEPGDVVLDLFASSGTSIDVAKAMGGGEFRAPLTYGSISVQRGCAKI